MTIFPHQATHTQTVILVLSSIPQQSMQTEFLDITTLLINTSVDESLIGTKSHSALTQYLLNKKHHKWGIKFWMLCDSVIYYCLEFYCYRGA